MGITSVGQVYTNKIILKILINNFYNSCYPYSIKNKYPTHNLTQPLSFFFKSFFTRERAEINVSPTKPTVLRTRLAVSSLVKALAEIFDFVAGLMQRVPKKTSIAKSDLQNSTADRAPSTHLALLGK